MARQHRYATPGQMNSKAVIKSGRQSLKLGQLNSLVRRFVICVTGLGLKSRAELVIHVIKQVTDHLRIHGIGFFAIDSLRGH
jgi:hypothetical protein